MHMKIHFCALSDTFMSRYTYIYIYIYIFPFCSKSLRVFGFPESREPIDSFRFSHSPHYNLEYSHSRTYTTVINITEYKAPLRSNNRMYDY